MNTQKSFKIFLTVFFVLFFFSCSEGDTMFDEKVIEIERTIKDTTQTTNNNNNDSTNTDPPSIIIIKDTIKLSYEKYMTLNCTVSSGQGAACYGKYLIQCFNYNPAIEIFDLEKKEYVCKVASPYPGNKTHANTVNFGNQKFSPDDYFPLLYISSGYGYYSGKAYWTSIYVYRLTKQTDSTGTESFNLEYVNTITLKGFNYWTEGIIDNENNKLWVKYDDSGININYACFEMPRFEDGNVSINRADAIQDFSLGVQPFTSSNQGHLFHNGKILLVSGTSPASQKLAFIVIDPTLQERELVIDLNDIGLSSEPENLFFYDGQMMIGYRGAVYKFNLYPLNK